MEDFEAALNVAVHTQQIPLLFFGELSLAEESKALRSIAIALSKSALGDTASIEAALSRIENRTIFATDFDTERVVIGGSVFGLDMPLPGMTLYQSTLLTPLRLHDYACYESKLEQASIDLKAGLPMSTMSMSSMPTMMLRVMLPDLSRLEGAIRKADKALATARMVFALERFHHLGLPYPQRLDDLVPTYVTAETLQDIQPFGYILTAGSWWLDTAESYDPKQPQLMLSPSRHDVWKSPMRPQQQ